MAPAMKRHQPKADGRPSKNRHAWKVVTSPRYGTHEQCDRLACGIRRNTGFGHGVWVDRFGEIHPGSVPKCEGA